MSTSASQTTGEKIPHILATLLCFLTLCLLFVGAMVTSTSSGLSVPDWPTTFGQNMFAYPLSAMRGGVVYEHSHRLFASTVGMLTILLAISVWIWEPRRWIRKLSLTALVLVCLQGLLGGLTVKFKLPVAVSSMHAGLAELFFCAMLWLSAATSPIWKKTPAWRTNPVSRVAFLLMALLFIQIIIGAIMRHSYAGLAIPTFPKAFDYWIPPFWNSGIALNFAHTRIGPLLIIPGCLLFVTSLLRQTGSRKSGWLLFAILVLQVNLGILTVLSGKAPWIASLHLAMGALLFGTLFSIGLWSGKRSFGIRT